ncbi:hypothetical protein PIB30_049108 [Stylosanthes scabra]|uniref:Uncharacterized protein n=1 Tax=Stylosanthes scabra TaxID=79078 RepID=A0ABU6TJ72_9FABA|nr:hypothetical protein [Stylosanthes scabra]
MTKDGGRGCGAANRGRGRPRKKTATGGLSAGLRQMVMILTPGSTVQSSETDGAPQA